MRLRPVSIKGVNPEGKVEHHEVATNAEEFDKHLLHVAGMLYHGWSHFTIEVEELDNEPDHSR